MKFFEEAAMTDSRAYSVNFQDEEDSEEGNDGKDIGRRRNNKSDASTVVPVPIAIFYVNHQIKQEATEVFYRFNRFTFDSDVLTAFDFLRGLHPSSRRQLKDIAFTSWSTCADDANNREFWDPLSTFIECDMSLCSVTVQVPRGYTCGVDKTKEVRDPPDPEWYWWPAARRLTELLMAGKIHELRIGYSATLKIPAPEGEDAQYKKAGQCQQENLLESLSSVSLLRYPQPQEERDRESSEYTDFMSAVREGRPPKFASVDALEADLQSKRLRIDFAVARQDDPIGDIGTVLVLTRPTAVQRLRA